MAIKRKQATMIVQTNGEMRVRVPFIRDSFLGREVRFTLLMRVKLMITETDN